MKRFEKNDFELWHEATEVQAVGLVSEERLPASAEHEDTLHDAETAAAEAEGQSRCQAQTGPIITEK